MNVTEYYRLTDNRVVYLEPGTYEKWVAGNNAKADIHLPIYPDPIPTPTNNKQVVDTWVERDIPNKKAYRRYSLRNMTAEELRQIWTSYQFLTRFTGLEREAIRTEAKTNSNVADFLMLATAAQVIISDDPITVAGMGYLVSIGLITEQRKNQILDGSL